MKSSAEGDDWFLLFRQGDKNAFRHAFERYYRSVGYFAQKILQDDTYAEDIVSEAFRKAWDNRERFATPKHLENFLYLVTRNDCISHLRSNRFQKGTDKEWIRLTAEPEYGDSIDLERVQTKLIEVIFEKLEDLPGGNVLRMSYIEGKSTKEIALELNTTENNVYLIKSRTLKSLRNLLTNKEWMLFLLLFIRHS